MEHWANMVRVPIKNNELQCYVYLLNMVGAFFTESKIWKANLIKFIYKIKTTHTMLYY